MTTDTIQPEHFANETGFESESSIRVVRRVRWGLAGIGPDRAAVVVYPVSAVTGRTPVAFDGLRVTEYRDLQVFENGVASERFTAVVIECEDDSSCGPFCRLANDLGGLIAAGGEADAAALRDRIDEWVRLFRRRRNLTADEEVGLWGELHFIQQAIDVSSAMRAWHGSESHPLDFVTAALAVEIKTSTRGHRHRTTPQQVQVGEAHPNAHVCSNWIQESPSGATICELVAAVRETVDDPGEFERRLLETGYDDRILLERRFEVVGDPIVLPWAAIPRITAMDPGVLDPSYAFDVESIEPPADGSLVEFRAD